MVDTSSLTAEKSSVVDASTVEAGEPVVVSTSSVLGTSVAESVIVLLVVGLFSVVVAISRHIAGLRGIAQSRGVQERMTPSTTLQSLHPSNLLRAVSLCNKSISFSP